MLERLQKLWLGFKVFTVVLSFVLFVVFLVISAYVMFHGLFFLGVICAFFALGFRAFSGILAEDIEREENPPNPDNMTIFKFK
jgi:hypothetical protein